MEVNGREHVFGIYEDRNKANEVAMRVRDERDCAACVYGTED